MIIKDTKISQKMKKIWFRVKKYYEMRKNALLYLQKNCFYLEKLFFSQDSASSLG